MTPRTFIHRTFTQGANVTISKKYSYPLIVGIVLVVLWEYATELFNISGILLPPPTEIFAAYMEFADLIHSNITSTVLTAIIGFGGAFLLAFLTAIVLTYSDRVRYALMPLIVSFNTVPRVALAPLIIFYVGGFDAKYLISAWMAFFPIVISSYEGLAEVDEDIEMLFESVGATELQKLVHFRIPNAIPFIIDGAKIGVILAIVGSIVGEFVASNEGVGYLALVALGQYNIALMFAITIIMGLIALIAFYILHAIQSRVVYWGSSSMIGAGDSK